MAYVSRRASLGRPSASDGTGMSDALWSAAHAFIERRPVPDKLEPSTQTVLQRCVGITFRLKTYTSRSE